VTISPALPRAAAPRTPRPLPRALLLAVALAAPSPGVQAQDACLPAFQVGTAVWYAFEPQPRTASVSDSGCTAAAGKRAQVVVFPLGSRTVIYCDLALSLPAAMQADLEVSQRQEAAGLPSARRSLPALWAELLRRYASALTCAPGFRRMSEASSGVPSVWCRRQLSATELCPRTGSAFSDGTCTSMACPAGMVDLDLSTGGKLTGCGRCPAGQLDLAESLASRDQPARSSADHPPVTAVLCKARASDPCPSGPPGKAYPVRVTAPAAAHPASGRSFTERPGTFARRVRPGP
jgi:hypothetical protein